jgi:hypothetical protein
VSIPIVKASAAGRSGCARFSLRLASRDVILALDKRDDKRILAAKFMPQNKDKIIREFLRRAGSKGGKARAAKYDKATLSKWARKGGRPKRNDKKEK